MADVSVPTTPTNPADLLRQVAEHAPKVLPERIVKPLLSALTFLAKAGHDSHHPWLAGRLARGVLALPEPSAVPATQDDLREQVGAAVMALLKRFPLAPPDQFGGQVGRLGATEHDVADAVLTVVNPVLEGLRAELDAAVIQRDKFGQLHLSEAKTHDETIQSLREAQAEVEQWRATFGETALRDATAIIAELVRQRESRAALSSLLRGMARRATKLRRGMRGHEARIAHLVSRPSVSDQTPATPDGPTQLARSASRSNEEAGSVGASPWRCVARDGLLLQRCILASDHPLPHKAANGYTWPIGAAPASDVPGLNPDCTADEAACVHGQTADLTGLAAREAQS